MPPRDPATAVAPVAAPDYRTPVGRERLLAWCRDAAPTIAAHVLGLSGPADLSVTGEHLPQAEVSARAMASRAADGRPIRLLADPMPASSATRDRHNAESSFDPTGRAAPSPVCRTQPLSGGRASLWLELFDWLEAHGSPASAPSAYSADAVAGIAKDADVCHHADAPKGSGPTVRSRVALSS